VTNELQPRHKKLVDYLETRSPSRFGVDDLAKRLGLSTKVLRNEIPKLVDAGYLKRWPVGRTFEYYVDKTPSKYKPTSTKVTPGNPTWFGTTLVMALMQENYKPLLSKLEWSIPYAVAHLTSASVTGDLSYQQAAKEALETYLEASEAVQLACRTLLATDPLWDDRLVGWLSSGLREDATEILEKQARHLLETYGRLESSKQETNTD
jgi:hypothetical protein